MYTINNPNVLGTLKIILILYYFILCVLNPGYQIMAQVSQILRY